MGKNDKTEDIELVSMKVMEKGNFLAFVDFVGHFLGVRFNDFRLIRTKTGTFVSSPAKSFENKDGSIRWLGYVVPIGRGVGGFDYFDHLVGVALKRYEALSLVETAVLAEQWKETGPVPSSFSSNDAEAPTTAGPPWIASSRVP